MKMKKSEKSIFEQFKAPKVDWIMFVYIHVMQEMKSKIPARWEHIRKAKEVAGHRLAIIGNGDVFSRRDAAAHDT